MKYTLRIAAYTFAAAAALMVSACAGGNAARFAPPAGMASKLTLTTEQVAGHKFETTEETGTLWFSPASDGTLTAGGNGKIYEKAGRWQVRDGNLCIEGKTWWRGGQCYEVYAASLDEIGRWRPIAGDYSKRYYPLRKIQ